MLAPVQDKFSYCAWLLCDKTQEPSLLVTPMDYSFNLQFVAWLQVKVRGRPLYIVGPWFFYCFPYPSIYLYNYLSIYLQIYIYIYIERERERERERKSKIFFFVHISKACSYFPREFDKILGYHRRNKGKNYVNFGDQMTGSRWYDWLRKPWHMLSSNTMEKEKG